MRKLFMLMATALLLVGCAGAEPRVMHLRVMVHPDLSCGSLYAIPGGCLPTKDILEAKRLGILRLEPYFNGHAILVPDGVYCTDDPSVVGPKAKRHFVIPADPGRLLEKEGDQ
jgi:hypothetical protein